MFIRGITRKSETRLIEYAAAVHLLQREFYHVQRFLVFVCLMIGHQKREVVRRRELRCMGKAAVFGVEHAAQRTVSRFNKFIGHCRCGSFYFRFGKHGDDLFALRNQRLALGLPQLGYAAQQLRKPHAPVRAVGRKVRSGKERLFLRRHKYRKRPAAAARHRLTHAHVHLVDVGPLFPVHFDGHEAFVELVCDFFIFEALMRHHMAPMAGGIADGEKHGFILRARFFEGFVAPRIPVYRVMSVLKKIAGLFVGEAV